MKPADVAKEFLYPFTEMAIPLAVLFFWIIYSIAKIAIVVIPVVGIVGATILIIWALPGFFRYLLFILEVRANGNDAPALDAELFGLADKLWSLSPLVLVAIIIWGGITVSPFGIVAVALYSVLVLFLLPASIAILAITRSPLESLSPHAIFRMVRICGPAYLLIPAIFVAMSIGIRMLASEGASMILLEWLVVYEVVLLFTFTGAVLHAKEVSYEVEIEASLEATADDIASDLDQAREKVVNHAYGFISRGNRDGGFRAHSGLD